jgi:hypothetical protein
MCSGRLALQVSLDYRVIILSKGHIIARFNSISETSTAQCYLTLTIPLQPSGQKHELPPLRTLQPLPLTLHYLRDQIPPPAHHPPLCLPIIRLNHQQLQRQTSSMAHPLPYRSNDYKLPVFREVEPLVSLLLSLAYITTP